MIERTENGFQHARRRARRGQRLAPGLPPWEGRTNANKVLTCSYQEAAEYSRLRREGLASWRGSFERDSFGWVERPVLNPYTRIAVEMCPARGILRAVGYELRTAMRSQGR